MEICIKLDPEAESKRGAEKPYLGGAGWAEIGGGIGVDLCGDRRPATPREEEEEPKTSSFFSPFFLSNAAHVTQHKQYFKAKLIHPNLNFRFNINVIFTINYTSNSRLIVSYSTP
jgi:hypothetical protein